MAHLLVVESWVGSMSRLLPRAIRENGHAFTFLTRDLHHYLRSAPEGTAHPLLGARHVITADTNDIEALLPEVERLHGVLGFDGVVTSCDYYLPAVARIAGRLGLPGPGPEAVGDACRKDSTRRVLDDAGVPGPRFAVREEWSDIARAARDIGYPLVASRSTCARACTCAGWTTRPNWPPPAGRCPTSRSTPAASGVHPWCCSKSCWTGPR